MCMRLIKILEGICARKDGESDSEFITRCGNSLTREPDWYNDRDTANVKLQKQIIQKKTPWSPFDQSVRDSDSGHLSNYDDYMTKSQKSKITGPDDEDELDNNSVCDNNEYEDGEFGSANNTTLLGGPGTPIQDTGISYYPQQAVAVQLTGMNTGR